MSQYPWAANPLKLQRAIAKAKEEHNTSDRGFNEEFVKQEYLKLGGQVLKNESPVSNPPVPELAPLKADGVSITKEPKPRRGRPNADKAPAENPQE